MVNKVDWLMSRLNSVYCHTCAFQENEKCCDECRRKSMNWSISQREAEIIVKKILEESDNNE
jgi:deoxyribodipyrimidine photolyase-like uncharacterized protein